MFTITVTRSEISDSIVDNIDDQEVEPQLNVANEYECEFAIHEVQQLMRQGLELAFGYSNPEDEFVDWAVGIDVFNMDAAEMNDMCQSALLSPSLLGHHRPSIALAHEVFQMLMLLERAGGPIDVSKLRPPEQADAD